MKAPFATRVVTALLVVSWLVRPIAGQGSGGGATVNVWVTTADQSQLLTAQTAVAFGPDSGSNPLTIDVNDATTYQQMDGFGASFTESSAYLVHQELDATTRDALMKKLFDPVVGIGLSYLRQPMGASDFALSSYTYDDTNDLADPTLPHFSISRDQQDVIPALLQALQINPKLRVMATPWSAPAWMKANGSLNGGSVNTDATTMTALANYFVKFVQQYTAAGVPIHRVTPQNEPLNTSSSYPTMYMDATTQANFIAKYLAPAFTRNNVSTAIVTYDHNWDNTSYPQSVLGSSAGSSVEGSAWHCYAGSPSAMTTVHNAYPTKSIFFTECSAGDWSTSFSSNLHWDMENLVIGAPRNWARTITKWNLALDTAYGPQNGGCTNCRGLVTIDRTVTPATYSFNFDYYALGHISKFVQPGAYRIASNTFNNSIQDVAFRNPDGSKALIVFNADTRSHTFKVRQGTASFTYTLPGGAAATFTWSDAAQPPADAPPTVSITAPPTGATYTAPATITLQANAADDGSVTNVAYYYAGSTPIGSSAAGNPYAVTWNVTTPGTYTVTAVATDNAGQQTTSSPITVTVSSATDAPPTVTMTSPTSGAVYTAPATISLAASARDDVGVAKVNYFNGSTLIGTATTPPYSASWKVTAPGTYVVTAVAIDTAGQQSQPAQATVTVKRKK